jgi:hypothetical protein
VSGATGDLPANLSTSINAWIVGSNSSVSLVSNVSLLQLQISAFTRSAEEVLRSSIAVGFSANRKTKPDVRVGRSSAIDGNLNVFVTMFDIFLLHSLSAGRR